MALRFLPRSPDLRERWDRLVHDSPDGWIWALYDWQDIVASIPAWGVVDHGFAVEESGDLLAVVPLGYWPNGARLESSGWGRTGPVLRRNLAPSHLRKLTGAITAHIVSLGRDLGARSLVWGSGPVTERSLANQWGVNPFVYFGFRDISTLSRVLDLRKGEEGLWKELSATTRNIVRRCRDEGYTVEPVEWPSYLDQYYEAHVETYNRTGVPPHPRAYFESIANIAAAQGLCRLWASRAPDGHIASFANIARYERTYYYWTACSRTDDLGGGINRLLLWTAIADAARSSGEWFDMGDVFPGVTTGKTAGLSTFKSKFGGGDRRHFGAMLEIPQPEAKQIPPVERDAEPMEDSAEPLSQLIRDTRPLAKRWLIRLLGRRFCRDVRAFVRH